MVASVVGRAWFPEFAYKSDRDRMCGVGSFVLANGGQVNLTSEQGERVGVGDWGGISRGICNVLKMVFSSPSFCTCSMHFSPTYILPLVRVAHTCGAWVVWSLLWSLLIGCQKYCAPTASRKLSSERNERKKKMHCQLERRWKGSAEGI